MPPSSPEISADGVRVSVTCNGRPLADDLPLVSLHIRHAVDAVSTAWLVLLDGDQASGRWPLADGGDFEPGAVIGITLGRGDERQTAFEGPVVRLGLHIAGDAGAQLAVECQGRADADAAVVNADDEPLRSVAWGIELMTLRAELDAPDEGLADPPRPRGHMRLAGHVPTRPGARIELRGVGAAFSGQVLVRQVEHEWSIADGWTTAVEFGPAPP